MNERGLVEVPENGVRDEPIAFGLTGVQLGICGIAVLVGAALNLLPLWEPLRLALIALFAGPIALAAALPIHGEPAYRWLIRAMRFLRSRRTWSARLIHQEVVTADTDKPPVSGRRQTMGPMSADGEGGLAWQGEDNTGTQPQRASLPGHIASADEASVPAAGEQIVMEAGQLLRPHLLRPEDDGSDEPPATPAPERDERTPVPHLLPGLRIALFCSFAGGVGKTTLAVEAATFIAAHARYRTLEGDERPLRVLLLDASRVTSGAAAVRLGLDGEAIARASNPVRWYHPRSIEDLAVATPSGVDAALAPAHPTTLPREPQPEAERDLFRADRLDDFLDGAREVGYQLLVVDLGSHLEDGHRHLIDRSDLICGVVRPTLESLPDVHRLANVLRELGAGRKLGLVANFAEDDRRVRQHAHEYGLAVGAVLPPSATFVTAAERGEPAWSLDLELRPGLRALAAVVWPLLSDGSPAPRGGLLASARRLAGIGRGAEQ